MSHVTPEIQDQVSELYITFFGRAADAIGFAHWAQSLANGATVSQIAESFSQTPEFASQYGGLTPEQQVARFYENVLNRAPDAEGLAYWTAKVDAGMPFYDVAYAIVNTAFVGGPGVGAADNGLVMNKVAVSEYFAIELASNDFAVAQTAFVGLTDTPESLAAKEAQLDAAVNAGTTYTLTTGIDTVNVIGTQVATVVGVQQSADQTWNTGDSITGNGNTTVSLTANGGTASIVTLNNINELNTNLVANTSINASEFTNVDQIWIRSGVTDTALTLTNADLTSAYGISVARGVEYNINSAATGSADEAVLAAVGAGLKSTDRATFDLSGGNAVESVALVTGGSNFLTLAAGTAATTIEVTGSGTNDLSLSSAATTYTLDASEATGVNKIAIGSNVNSSVTVLGGAARDLLSATVGTVAAVTPTVTDMDEIRLSYTAAGTYNGSKTTGVDTLTINTSTAAAAAAVSNLNASVTTVNLGYQSATVGGQGTAIGYASGTTADVTVNVGATSSSSDPGVATGALTMTNQAGALTINSIGDAANSIASVTNSKATSVDLQGVTQSLSVTGALSATSATEITIDGSLKNTSTGSLTVDQSLATLNVSSGAGTAASGALSAYTATGAVDLTVNLSTADATTSAKTASVGNIGTITGKANTDMAFAANVTSGAATATIGTVAMTTGTATTAAQALTVTETITSGAASVALGNQTFTLGAGAAGFEGTLTADITMTGGAGQINNGTAVTGADFTFDGNAANNNGVAATFDVSAGSGGVYIGDVTVQGGTKTASALNFTGVAAAGTLDLGTLLLESDSISATSTASIELTATGGNIVVDSIDLIAADDGGANNGTVAGAFILSAASGQTLTITDLDDGTDGIQGLASLTLSGAGDISVNAANTGAFVNAIATEITSSSTGATTVNLAGSTTSIVAILGNAASGKVNTLTTGAGADSVIGGSGAEAILAGGGSDTITAGAGNDTITGATGADLLTGGTGSNQFFQVTGASIARSAENVTDGAVVAGETITFANGVDIITDFDTSVDTINTITAASLTTFVEGSNVSTVVVHLNYAIRGDYAAGVFTINNAGADTLVLADAVAGAFTANTQTSMMVLEGVTDLAAANFI